MTTRLGVLFVCSGPGVRGSIAEAYLRHFASDSIETKSARFEDIEGRIPAFVLQLMQEEGVEMPQTFPVSVFQRHKDRERFDYVITLCHASSSVVCPVFKNNIDVIYRKDAERLSWSIRDFRSLGDLKENERMAAARAIRDQIKAEVIAFLQSVQVSSRG